MAKYTEKPLEGAENVFEIYNVNGEYSGEVICADKKSVISPNAKVLLEALPSKVWYGKRGLLYTSFYANKEEAIKGLLRS